MVLFYVLFSFFFSLVLQSLSISCCFFFLFVFLLSQLKYFQHCGKCRGESSAIFFSLKINAFYFTRFIF